MAKLFRYKHLKTYLRWRGNGFADCHVFSKQCTIDMLFYVVWGFPTRHRCNRNPQVTYILFNPFYLRHFASISIYALSIRFMTRVVITFVIFGRYDSHQNILFIKMLMLPYMLRHRQDSYVLEKITYCNEIIYYTSMLDQTTWPIVACFIKNKIAVAPRYQHHIDPLMSKKVRQGHYANRQCHAIRPRNELSSNAIVDGDDQMRGNNIIKTFAQNSRQNLYRTIFKNLLFFLNGWFSSFAGFNYLPYASCDFRIGESKSIHCRG
jgi:hypothetical protein